MSMTVDGGLVGWRNLGMAGPLPLSKICRLSDYIACYRDSSENPMVAFEIKAGYVKLRRSVDRRIMQDLAGRVLHD